MKRPLGLGAALIVMPMAVSRHVVSVCLHIATPRWATMNAEIKVFPAWNLQLP